MNGLWMLLQVDSIHIIRGNNKKGEMKMYIDNKAPKYYESESNAPVNWVANKIIIRNDKNEIQEVNIPDDEE